MINSKRMLAVLAGIFLFTGTAVAADIDVYGAFNYKLSNDENTSGASYSKLEDNGSKLGLDISEPIADGQSLNAFAKLEVGVDTDDSGSDTFDSRLAYVGLDTGQIKASVGRQSHPFTDNIGGKSGVFNVYGGAADFSYASRSSNSIALSSSNGPLTLDSLAIVDGSSGEDGIDEYEITLSTTFNGSDISIGYADDVANDISYWGAGSSTDLGPLNIATSYTIKDAATDLTGWEVAGTYSIFSLGYGDKEGTANYTTVGVSKEVATGLTLYAEAEQVDNDTGTDQEKWSLGTKYSF
tara:strand:- start:53 stop:940 length:888 start_codon:yes stop_codon:yes gene_type:complete